MDQLATDGNTAGGAEMEMWEAIDSIRVVREFSARPPPDEHVTRIVNAGRRAGSSKNLQRWAFVVVRNRDRLHQLAEAGAFASHVAGASIAIALVTPDPGQPGQPLSVMWDLGRAAQNMVLTAWDLGIGSAPATVYEHHVVDRVLNLPTDRHCEYILSFGYPANPSVLTVPKERGGRLRLEQVMHEEVWAPEGGSH